MRFDICGIRYKDKGGVVSKLGTEGEKVYKKSDRTNVMQSLSKIWLIKKNLRKDLNVNQF